MLNFIRKRITSTYFLVIAFLFYAVSCSDKNNSKHNIYVDSGAEVQVDTTSKTNSNYNQTNNKSVILREPDVTSGISNSPIRAMTGTGQSNIQKSKVITGSVNDLELESLGGTTAVDFGTTQVFGIGPSVEKKQKINYSYTQQLKPLNYLIFSLFIFLIAGYILHLSAESWISFKWFRRQEILNKRKKNYGEEINQLIDQVGKLNVNPESSMENYIHKLNEEIEYIRKKRGDIDNNNLELNLGFERKLQKNIIFYLIIFVFGFIYLNTTLFLLGIRGIDFFNFALHYPDVISFLLLIIGSYFSIISLFRFALTQGSYSNYTKNKMSFFGVLVSLVTLTGAIITISQFLTK